MLSRFLDHIATHDLAGTSDRVLLAVSGGLDSMVMLHLFREGGFPIGVAHANFSLRGKDSDGDEAFVEAYCKKHGISYYGKRFNTKNYAESKKVSIQMAARDLRYEWFNELLESEKYHWLATAHHLNDNLETVLLRWTNGAGLDQLTGIPVKNDRVIRPVLFASRSEIEAYARESNVEWREDASNTTTVYQRNFIRHEIIPRLKEINPSLEKTFGESRAKLSGAAEQMQRGLGQLRDSITRMEGRDFFIDKNLLGLLRYPDFVCYEWLKPFGFEWERCKQLVESMSGQPGARFLSETHQAVIDREYIIVSPLEEAFPEVLIEEGQDKAGLGPWVLTIHREKVREISTDKEEVTLDAAKVKFPLVWRHWRPGDSFVPLGMKKSKKVSDFLIDEKVPLTEKNRVTVVTSADAILWVAGYRVDDRYKVGQGTTSIIRMHLK